ISESSRSVGSITFEASLTFVFLTRVFTVILALQRLALCFLLAHLAVCSLANGRQSRVNFVSFAWLLLGELLRDPLPHRRHEDQSFAFDTARLAQNYRPEVVVF